MKEFITYLFAGSILFTSCRKEESFLSENSEPCEIQTENPSGRTYSEYSIIETNTNQKFCGIVPLNKNNYWVYQDSVYTDGVFSRVQYDTLRYTPYLKSLTDGIIWWQSNISTGIPEVLYSSDSALFTIEDRIFTSGFKDVKMDFSLFAGDSIRFISSFHDAAAIGRSLKMYTELNTSMGTFSDCIYTEKNARNYRRDQVIFKPGIGVVKYIYEKAAMGQRIIQVQKILTLVSYHLE